MRPLRPLNPDSYRDELLPIAIVIRINHDTNQFFIKAVGAKWVALT